MGRQLPRLKRTYLSFHHLCGRQTEEGVKCQVYVDYERNHGNYYISPNEINATRIHDVSSANLANSGKVDNITKWFYEHIQMPTTNRLDRLVITAEFDDAEGGVGFDNIHLTTPQKCVPRWTTLKGFEFSSSAYLRIPQLSGYEAQAVTYADLGIRYGKSRVPSIEMEDCARYYVKRKLLSRCTQIRFWETKN